jgi:A/G-specific adenine glycosylase
MISPAVPPPEQLSALRRALLGHYDETSRDLPWRGETDAYRIWVSEVMLQQTRVETVIPYYKRWVEQFPDIDSLADADLDDVLLAWQGLGYYRRARGLLAGAAVVRERHGGRMPTAVDDLRGLPGVGEYTAGAVASIAYGTPVGAVDGNVRRVLARLFDVPAPTAKWLRATAADLVDPRRAGDWNQALMELGALVCAPRSPRCGECPLATWCAATKAGTQEDRPAPVRKKTAESRTWATAVVVDRSGHALVVRRPPDGLLAGMWAFPDALLDGDGAAPAEGRAGRADPGRRPSTHRTGRTLQADQAVTQAAARTAAEAAAEACGVGLAAKPGRPVADPAHLPLDPNHPVVDPAHTPAPAAHAATPAAHAGTPARHAATPARHAATPARHAATAARHPAAWSGRPLDAVLHRFTHLTATYLPVLLAGDGPEDENRRWIPLAGPWPVALPVAQQKIAAAAAAALMTPDPLHE